MKTANDIELQAGRKSACGFFVPQDGQECSRLRAAADRFVAVNRIVPPLAQAELDEHAVSFIRENGLSDEYEPFARIVVNNAAWAGVVASIPFNRRTLLLPPCLRDRRKCRAEFDALGLMCEQCGSCDIGSLSEEAESLGYTVIVAEGTGTVTALIEKGMLDGVIGVSCMASLQRAFPSAADNAVPGLAIPLLRDGCDGTGVDLSWVREALHLKSGKAYRAMPDLDLLKSEVNGWFEVPRLEKLMRTGRSEAEAIGISWLAKSGKRWRPVLAALVFRILREESGAAADELIGRTAVAVECFHKASLIHDDIEDNDDFRYGEETLHRQYGVPIALNTGDLLLGEGYRLTSECDVTAQQKAQMFSITAEGHRDLSLGQGAELCWMRNRVPLAPGQVLDIFRMKTAPAFEVALRLGAVCAGADEGIHEVLRNFSRTMGIAYQIRDDIDDFFAKEDTDDLAARRPSFMLALAYEKADPGLKKLLGSAWCEGKCGPGGLAGIRSLVVEMGIEKIAVEAYEHYRKEAFLCLHPLKHHGLKLALFRILNRILKQDADAAGA